MKKKFGKEILDEFAVEVNETVPETIRKLQELSGPCRSRDSNDYALMFLCDNTGRFRVDQYDADQSRYGYDRLYLPGRIAYVQGRVTEENGKTVVRAQSIFSHSGNAWRVFGLVMESLSLIVYAVLLLLDVVSFSFLQLLILLVIIGVCIGVTVSTSNNESYYRQSDLEIMKQEVLDRVHAVERWDE